MRCHIPLDLTDPTDPDQTRRATLTTESIYARYRTPVLDVGDAVDYGPSETVPRYGRTAAELVVDGWDRIHPWGPLDDASVADQQSALAEWRRSVVAFLGQWPEGPQLAAED